MIGGSACYRFDRLERQCEYKTFSIGLEVVRVDGAGWLNAGE